MYILGISAFYHDSAAVLLKNGQIICAIEEERLSRIKHDNSFPLLAINQCLEEAGITINEVKAVAYYEKPLLKFERILESVVKDFPFSLKLFTRAIPDWLGNKIKVDSIIKTKLKHTGDIFYIPHHLSHAAAAFYTSPYKNAAILTTDGVGEYQTTALWIGEENRIKLIKSLNFPHSIGLLYSIFTSFLGFKVNEDEYKLMGLSAYGKPEYKHNIYKILDLESDGSFQIKPGYLNLEDYRSPWTSNFTKLFGNPKKTSEPFRARHKNIAASIQETTEEVYLRILNHLQSLTTHADLCVGGGVGLNALANGKIYKNTLFKQCSVFGAAGDSGAALGAALFYWHSVLNNKPRTVLDNLKIGTSYETKDVQNTLKKKRIKYKQYSLDNLTTHVSKLLSGGAVVGWFQGQMEFGPRSLGGRSILANPSKAGMKTKVNTIKLREQYRPFAGSVLQEKVHELFEVPEPNHSSPFMTFCFKVRPSKISLLSSITHKDGTCRIQTVNESDPIYYQLIKKFNQLTGIPCLLNTSFNLGGEPIVETPEQAITDFQKTKLDYLVIDNFLLSKK